LLVLFTKSSYNVYKAEVRGGKMNSKLRVGILGGTGFVGQRFVTLLENHPYFEVVCIAASGRSANKPYEEAVKERWKLDIPMPEGVKNIIVKDINEIEAIGKEVDFVFCAVDMPKNEIKALEEAYAKAEIPVVSNNSAHRTTPDVPMVIPEINAEHFNIIESQKKRLGTKYGFIAVKPNCSIQSYVPALEALKEFGPKNVVVTTYQAISGAGKTFKDWPEMSDNVIPYIGGEEEKSEQEPLKIWGNIEGDAIVHASSPVITTQCIRVPVSDGHLAAVFVTFEKKPSKEQILELWRNYKGKPQLLELPSAPKQFLTYFTEENRPQTGIDRDVEKGMGITLGRLREDNLFHYKFVCLSHNTLRGAAGGAVLTAELLKAEGFLVRR
jgi:aspartate-semialdehyde dehydrogenase